jgi:hypothetical protein
MGDPINFIDPEGLMGKKPNTPTKIGICLTIGTAKGLTRRDMCENLIWETAKCADNSYGKLCGNRDIGTCMRACVANEIANGISNVCETVLTPILTPTVDIAPK